MGKHRSVLYHTTRFLWLTIHFARLHSRNTSKHCYSLLIQVSKILIMPFYVFIQFTVTEIQLQFEPLLRYSLYTLSICNFFSKEIFGFVVFLLSVILMQSI